MKIQHIITILFYFAFLLLVSFYNLLSYDTYYYWEWSRHLDFGYYDGSPLIAYFIKASTLLFGDTLFALSLVGVVSIAITSLIIYKTANLFLSKEASGIALLLWLFSPLVTLDLINQTTYDTPLTIFWALTLYFAAKYIISNQMKYLYFLGVSIGLMMLSKYSGAVLVLALVVFLLTTKYRYLFKSVHLYLAMLLAFALFSPVIIWNQQHDWQSFLYQLTTHQLKKNINPFVSLIKSFAFVFLPSLNFMLIPSLLCWIKKIGKVDDQRADIVRLCLVVSTTFICFYLLVATQDAIRDKWLSTYLISSALLGGYCYQTMRYQIFTHLVIGAYLIVSLGIVANNAFPIFKTTDKLIYYRLIQRFNAEHPDLPKTILTSSWLEARMLFFLKDKPDVYTIDCGLEQNEYAFWSKEVAQKINNKTLKEALFISPYDQGICVKKYFDHCDQLTPLTYSYKTKKLGVYAYICTNYNS